MKIGLSFILVADKSSVGYTGIYCQKQCPYPRCGDGCQQVCLCSKQRCNVITGCQFQSNSKFQSTLRITFTLLFLGLKKTPSRFIFILFTDEIKQHFARNYQFRFLITCILPNVVHNGNFHNIHCKEKPIFRNILKFHRI